MGERAGSLASKQAIQGPGILGHVSHPHNASARRLAPGGAFCPFSKGVIFRQGLDSAQDGGGALHVAIVTADAGLGDCHQQAPYGPPQTFGVFSLAPIMPTLRRNELPSLTIQEIST